MTGILNYAQLILDKKPQDASIERYAGSIVRESERVSEIVKNLLAFSRQDQQTHSPARMQDIAAATLSLVRALFRRDQIAIEADIPADLPTFECRSQQIQQVLLNLLTNARDATNERYPESDPEKRVRIETRLVERDGRRWLRTTVADSGNGIPAELRERIFDPFFTTKPRELGTGLGLSVSYGIVRAHHGELTFESDPGGGTRFFLDLPVDDVQLVELQDPLAQGHGDGLRPAGDTELAQDVLDVDVHGVLRELERHGDLPVAAPLQHVLQDLALARGEVAVRDVVGELAADLGGDVALAGVHGADRLQQLAARRALADVGPGPGLERLVDLLLAREAREHDDAAARPQRLQARRHVDAAARRAGAGRGASRRATAT